MKIKDFTLKVCEGFGEDRLIWCPTTSSSDRGDPRPVISIISTETSLNSEEAYIYVSSLIPSLVLVIPVFKTRCSKIKLPIGML